MNDEIAVQRLSALAQVTRVNVFKQLMRAGPDGIKAGVLADRLAVAPNTLSAHLAVLSEAGLVTVRRDGRARIYAIELEAIADLFGYLADDCCQGHPEVCAPLVRSGSEPAC